MGPAGKWTTEAATRAMAAARATAVITKAAAPAGIARAWASAADALEEAAEFVRAEEDKEDSDSELLAHNLFAGVRTPAAICVGFFAGGGLAFVMFFLRHVVLQSTNMRHAGHDRKN